MQYQGAELLVLIGLLVTCCLVIRASVRFSCGVVCNFAEVQVLPKSGECSQLTGLGEGITNIEVSSWPSFDIQLCLLRSSSFNALISSFNLAFSSA